MRAYYARLRCSFVDLHTNNTYIFLKGGLSIWKYYH